MSLKLTIQEDMKQALREGARERLATLRMIMAAVQQREVDERKELADSDVLQVLEKMIKQRRESAAQYRRGERPELAEREEAEIDLIQAYLPEPLSEAELEELIRQAIEETAASSVRDMGKVMGLIKTKAQGRADMGEVSARVKSRLASV